MTTRRKWLFAEIRESIEPLGFDSHGENVFEREVPNGLIHRITVPVDVPNAQLTMSCTVNLMVTSLPQHDSAAPRPRLSVNIGSITPNKNWLFWEVPLQTIDDEVIAKMTRQIHTYALPWFERFKSVEDVNTASNDDHLVIRRAMHSSRCLSFRRRTGTLA